MAADDIRRYSSDELKAMIERGDYAKTPSDAPTIDLDAAFWERAEAASGRPNKISVHLRVDPDTAEFFRRDGKGHLTRMARVLKAYADAKR